MILTGKLFKTKKFIPISENIQSYIKNETRANVFNVVYLHMIYFVSVLCLFGREMVPTRQRLLVKDTPGSRNYYYVGGATC